MSNKSGYVYILTNPCIQYSFKEGNKKKVISPVKIGYCKNLEKRIGTLNTSLPENFVLHRYVEANDPKAVENVVQRVLKDYRIFTKTGERTEFFTCPVKMAVDALKQTAKDMHLKEYKFKKDKLIGRSASKMRTNAMKSAKEMNNAVQKTWESKNQFALWIARKGGNEGSLGNILSILRSARPCTAKSKWRKLLEQEGIKFNATNFIKNWSSFEKFFIKKK